MCVCARARACVRDREREPRRVVVSHCVSLRAMFAAAVARAVGTRQFRATAPVRGGGGGAVRCLARLPSAAMFCLLPHTRRFLRTKLNLDTTQPPCALQAFDPKHPGVVSMVMDNWVGKGGVRDGWYWWDPKGHGAVAAGLASQILTLKTAAVVTIGTTICLIERTLDYREEKAHDRRHERRHGGH